jgi:hypothetical protein
MKKANRMPRRDVPDAAPPIAVGEQSTAAVEQLS